MRLSTITAALIAIIALTACGRSSQDALVRYYWSGDQDQIRNVFLAAVAEHYGKRTDGKLEPARMSEREIAQKFQYNAWKDGQFAEVVILNFYAIADTDGCIEYLNRKKYHGKLKVEVVHPVSGPDLPIPEAERAVRSIMLRTLPPATLLTADEVLAMAKPNWNAGTGKDAKQETGAKPAK